MARTYRCRHSCPKGWEVRDDDHVYFKNGHPSKAAREQARQAYLKEARDEGWPWWMRWRFVEDDPSPRRFRRRFTNREKKAERKDDFRSYRRRMDNLIRHERYDDIVNYTRTGGWLTW